MISTEVHMQGFQDDSGHGSVLQQRRGSDASGASTIGRIIDSSEWASTLKQHEVAVSGEQKGCVYIYDRNDGTNDDDTYIVVQVRYCRVGPPLLPTYEADGSLRWEVPDPGLRFDTYPGCRFQNQNTYIFKLNLQRAKIPKYRQNTKIHTRFKMLKYRLYRRKF